MFKDFIFFYGAQSIKRVFSELIDGVLMIWKRPIKRDNEVFQGCLMLTLAN